ncbi:MAG: hypothetical protein WC889_04155 [Myxococcota bacterium]
MQSCTAVRQLIETDDDVGLDTGTIFVVGSFPGEREFQALWRRYDEIAP